MTKFVVRTTIFLLIILSFNLFAQPDYREAEAKRKAESAAKWMSQQIKATSNQNSYDVSHYLIDIDFQPSVQNIIGMVRATVKVTDGPLNKVELDLASNMTVDSVFNGSASTSFTHSGNVVGVNLNSTANTDDIISVTVYYHGRPQASGLGSFGFDSFEGKHLIWTLSEPYGAREWWPCKDIPGDKADSVDLILTVPEPMIVASNGKLMDEITTNGKTTFVWKEKYPIPTYLISVTAYEFRKYIDYYISMDQDTMPIEFYVAPSHYNNSRGPFLQVNDMIEIFADLFGEYPFVDEKYGHAEFPWGGGMEHQTITSLGNIKFSGGFYSQGLIAHELAHQWWGDMISCGSFHHIWINEGFATYSEALIVEATAGTAAYHQQMQNEEYYGGGSIYVADTTNTGAIFSGALSYSKGSYVLHMLRHVIGDETFFKVLKTYGDDPRFKYGNAKTEDFQLVCEEVSGMNLDKFFQQWIYGERHPVYAYGYTVEEISNGYRLNLEIDQVQDNTGLFWMPIDIEITTSSGKESFVVWDSLQTQTFQFELSEQPVNVKLDPDNWILKKTREKLVNPPLNKGVLLVNGLTWSLGENVFSSYENKSYWGNTEVTVWDLFDEPNTGYPDPLKERLGNGEISIATLAQYSTIVWISHNRDGDMQIWKSLPIIDYLNAGGNIILITRTGQDFLGTVLSDYLGIKWEDPARKILRNCISVVPELVDMQLIQNHTFIDIFETTLTKDYSSLLFKSTEGFDEEKGIGVHAKPDGKGEFIYIAARPYLFEQESLKANMEYILQNYLGAVTSVNDEVDNQIPAVYSLEQNYPNPFNPTTIINYSLPKKSIVTITLYDLLGNEITKLVDDVKTAGSYQVKFNADKLSSGVYFYQIKTNEFFDTKKMILIK